MGTRVAINGFGRIGRCIFRLLQNEPHFDVVAINDLAGPGTLAYLLKYDSVYGRYKGTVSAADNSIIVEGHETSSTTINFPGELPWRTLGVDLVVESTGVFRSKEHCLHHIEAGAKKVLLTTIARGEVDASIIMGVNDHTLKPTDCIVATMSSVTNALAPIVKVVHASFGIKKGIMTALHANANDQVLLDSPHADLRRARAAAGAIIPTTIDALGVLGNVLPGFSGALTGTSFRVPVINGSMLDLVLDLEKTATVLDINRTVKEAAEKELAGIIEYCEDRIVSRDVVGNPASCVFDSECTVSIGGTLVQLISWFDNEWGYANRCVDVLKKMAGISG